MLSVREQVLQAVHAALANVDGVTLFRNLRRDVPEANIPALVLVDGGHSPPDDGESGVSEYEMGFDVEGFVKAAMDDELGPALSDLYARVVAVVLADRTLGGLAVDLTEGAFAADLDRCDGSVPLAAFNASFSVRYWTAQGDPYTLAP